jgi:hypothetical protein
MMFMPQYFRDEGAKALPPWFEVQYRFNIGAGLDKTNPITVYALHKNAFIDGVNNKLHRLDGPAVISKNRWEYYVDGKLHRTDGPAVKTIDGFKMWFNKK